MSSTNSQLRARDVSVWTDVLSSSIALATITGMFFLLGAAQHQGSSQALGLRYLATPQPAELIYSGAELLMASLTILGPFGIPGLYAILILIIVFGSIFAPMPKLARRLWLGINRYSSFRRRRRYLNAHFKRILITGAGRGKRVALGFLYVISVIATLCITGLVYRTQIETRSLLTRSSCPVNGQVSLRLWLVLLALIVFVGALSRVLSPGLVRLSFHAWGILMSFVCLYGFGWAVGAAQINEADFVVVQMSGPSLEQLLQQSKVLILGADDKNMVLLVSGEDHNRHPQPRYVIRSDIKIFRLVRTSSINDFFCPSQPRR